MGIAVGLKPHNQNPSKQYAHPPHPFHIYIRGLMQTNRKILVIVRDLAVNGPAIQMAALTRAWVQRGHRCFVLDLAPEQRDPALIRDRMDARVELVEGLSPRDLVGFIDRHGISRVISVGRSTDAFVSEGLREASAKPNHVCFISRQTGSYFSETNLSVIRSNLRHFDGHVVQSDDHVALLEKVHINKKRIHFIHNGVAVPEGRKKEGFRVAMCARGTAGKGWATAIGAVRQLIEEGETIELWLIGSGQGLEDLKHFASEHIHFLGQIADPQAPLQECTLGLLPTRAHSEGLPNSILDYFAAGLPTIASNRGGIPRLIDHPEHPAGALMDDPTDEAKWAGAIRNYLHNPELLAQHQAGVQAMQRLVDIESVADDWLDWMDGLAERPNRRLPGLFDALREAAITLSFRL